MSASKKKQSRWTTVVVLAYLPFLAALAIVGVLLGLLLTRYDPLHGYAMMGTFGFFAGILLLMVILQWLIYGLMMVAK